MVVGFDAARKHRGSHSITATEEPMSERLHKLLAQSGLGSRRELERWMLEGRVLLNGAAAKPGDRYQHGDRVVLDGRDVSERLGTGPLGKVIAYHKAQGQSVSPEQSMHEGEQPVLAEESVMERLPALRGGRWLVINTMQPGDSGLLLLTTDGRLADALRRRSEQIGAAYVTRVQVPTLEFDVAEIGLSVRFGEVDTQFEEIEPAGGEGTNRWFKVTAGHAHRRGAVRALFDSHGLTVSRVIQVRFGPIELARDLPRGRHRNLLPAEVEQLYQLAQLTPPAPPPAREAQVQRAAAKRGRRGPSRRATDSRKSGR
jgi:23S rRNA pseudouridine2605 synthase